MIFFVGGFIAGALRVGAIKGTIVGFASGLVGAIGLIGVYTPEVAGNISLQIVSLLVVPIYGLLYGIIHVLNGIELQYILIASCISGAGGLLGGAISYRTEGKRSVEWLSEHAQKRRR